MAFQHRESQYELLIRKLEEFARKYHQNQFYRRGIYFLILFLISFIVVAVVEYFGHFSTQVRTLLFYTFLLLNLTALFIGPGIPLLQMFRYRDGIDHKQAARIIGAHFPDVKDKLLNTIQLKESAESGSATASRELIDAAVSQRIIDLHPVPFVQAVNFRENLRYARYLAIPLLIILITFVAAPEAIIDSTGRLLDHRTHYERDMPFSFELQNDSLIAVRNQDFSLHLKISGDVIPEEVMVEFNGTRHRMRNDGRTEFHHRVRNPRQTKTFRFYADGFYSRPYELEVYPRPSLENFTVFLDYPEYTGKSPEELDNTGDMHVPEGTEVTWIFETRDVNNVLMGFEDTMASLSPVKGQDFRYTRTVTKDQSYSVRTSNEHLISKDSLRYYINVIPDERPSIQVQKQRDTASPRRIYFMGEISDDYGFSRLTFNYRFPDRGEAEASHSDALGIAYDKTHQQFYYQWDMEQIGVERGEQVEFFFRVWDNDAVNGPKATRSETFLYRSPTRRDVAEESRQSRDEIRRQFDESIDEMRRLRRELQEIERSMMGQEQLNWQDEQKISEMIERHREIQDQLREMQQQHQEDFRKQQEFGDMTPEMEERRQRMQELMEELMDEDKRKLLEELQKALDEQQKDRIQEKLRELEQQDRYSEREMERIRELFKQLDFEQKLRENIDHLRDMAQKQEELSQETGSDEADGEDSRSSEEISEEQQGLMEEFEQFKEEMKDLEQRNQELQRPKSMDEFEQQMQEIDQKMQESIEQLMQENRQGAQEQQQQSKDKMDEMAEKMESMQMEMDMEAAFVNYRLLRRVLQNLLHFSFNQEELLEAFGNVQEYNPQYVELGQKQSRLERYARLIEDSLYSLSTQIMQMGPMVSQEMNEIHYNLESTLQSISDRRMGNIRRHQQLTMTHANNLAVLLSEIMDNLQQQMAAQMEGEQMSQQMMDGMGEPSMTRMQELQEELNQRMQDMQESGEQMGGEENGEQMDEEYARIAAEQERLRRQLQEMREQMGEQLGDGGEELEKIEEEMEKTERDLLNRKIDQETLERQREITVRMLEYEEAERTQDQREEREAEQAREYEPLRPEDLEDFFRERDSHIERLQTMPPRLNYYYRRKVEEYFRKLSVE